MEAPGIPAWFSEELAARHPRIRLVWLAWREPKDSMLPILGLPMSRARSKTGRLYYRYRIPGLETHESVEWFPVDDVVFAPNYRFCVQQQVRDHYEKVFDCILDTGQLIPPSREVMNAIDARGHEGAWDELLELIEKDDAYFEEDDGQVLTKAEKILRDDVDQRMHGLEHKGLFAMYDPPKRHKAGFLVTDRRRFKDAC